LQNNITVNSNIVHYYYSLYDPNSTSRLEENAAKEAAFSGKGQSPSSYLNSHNNAFG